MQNEQEKRAVGAAIGDGINEFIQKYRKPIFVSAGAVLLILIAFIAALSIMDILNGKAIRVVEEFGARYETLHPSITEEYSAVDVEELLGELEAFARKNSGAAAVLKPGYAGGKAWSIIGSIHSDLKDWPAAETAWASAAKAAKKTYLTPLAFFNAGVAAEEQGKTEAAIEYYSSSLADAADFPSASRAQFAIGRLRESLGDNEAAIEAYRAVISGWPYDMVWPNLAQSRIIALEVE
jgi:tetratricopeptide (TPR) repeat protein